MSPAGTGLAPARRHGGRAAHALVPALIGALIAAGIAAEAWWARGMSLQWVAPWLRGEAPPLLSLLAAMALGILVAGATLLRGWLPAREHVPIVLLFVATQLVGFNLANIEPLKIALLIVCAAWLADALVNNRRSACTHPS